MVRSIQTEQRSFRHENGDGFDYSCVRSPRRKSMEIQVHADGSVHVRTPFLFNESILQRFLAERYDWVKKHAKANRLEHVELQSKGYQEGALFSYLGRDFPLSIQEELDRKRAKIDFDGAKWLILISSNLPESEKSKQIARALTRWYRQQAEELFGGRVFYYGRVMQDIPEEIKIKTYRRLWGSCVKATRLVTFNWQLIMAPLFVIDYVVVHELAHLKYMGHGKRFWQRVAKFLPDYKEAHKWLRDNKYKMHLPKIT